MRPEPARPRIGVDTGGTFTDLVAVGAGGEVLVGKVASTPDDPARALLAGLESLELGRAEGYVLVHGTTVALNALLTGKARGAALVTNEGFRDLIEIGRQERPDLYALEPERPAPLVPRERRFEIGQRSWPGHGDQAGSLVEARRPAEADLARLKDEVAASGAQSVAVCLLHSYADPAIERRVADALAPLGISITTSADILSEYREIERFSTAIVNASLVPLVRAYLARLEREIPEARLEILQSSGGTLPAARASVEPVRILLSGPAGGVVGAARAAAAAGLTHIATLDMGGTSTDVAFHDPGAGLANAASESRVAGHPVAVPTLDMHTIGCGGGSLVRVDAGGVLHVGPASAGADPGPVCYGRGEELTVTDAHLHLGHIAAEGFLDGGLPLDEAAVKRAFEELGRRLGTSSLDAAEAVLEVARASMRRALGVMTMERGRDPRRTPLVAFGGGGGLSAAALAASLDMPGALVPANPGVLSAWGMATADALSDHGRTVLAPLAAWDGPARSDALAALCEEGADALASAGHTRARLQFETSLALRYRGQSYDLPVPDGSDPAAAFHAAHRERYGWALEDHEVELVHLRARAVAPSPLAATPAVVPPSASTSIPESALRGPRRARFDGRDLDAMRVDRNGLEPGHRITGPAIIEEYSGTTLVPPGWAADVRAGGHLWLRAD